METGELVEGVTSYVPQFLNNAREGIMHFGGLIIPDNPSLGVLIILVIVALVLQSKVRGWMWLLLFIGVGFLIITGGVL